MAKIIGTAGSAPAAKPVRVKVKAHTRAAPAEPSHVVRPPKPAAAKPVKVRVKPFSPPQTPDSRDNNQQARHPNVSHVSPDAQDVAGRTAAQHAYDASYAQDIQDAASGKHPDLAKAYGIHVPKANAKVKVKTGHGPGHLIASITPGALVHALANVDAGASMPVFSGIAKVVGRGGSDAAEMAVTTPSSVAHLIDTGIHHPTQLPALLAKPYEDLARHPIKTLSEHPLQTALLVAPAVRMPGRVVGKVARAAGKQTLERTDATLPGSALREKRTGSRDAVARVVQAHNDRSNPVPTVTARDVNRRVDEYYGAAQRHMQRARAAANRQVKQRGLVGDAADEHISGVIGKTQDRLAQRFGREFGAIHQVTPGGHLMPIKPHSGVAVEGVLHDTRAAAQTVAEHLNEKPVVLHSGTAAPAVPLEWTAREAGDKFSVVPKLAADRLNHHQGVGTDKAMIARMMRTSRRQLTTTVLPVSPKVARRQRGRGGAAVIHGGRRPDVVPACRPRRARARPHRAGRRSSAAGAHHAGRPGRSRRRARRQHPDAGGGVRRLRARQRRPHAHPPWRQARRPAVPRHSTARTRRWSTTRSTATWSARRRRPCSAPP
jgi:hypothetical protein